MDFFDDDTAVAPVASGRSLTMDALKFCGAQEFGSRPLGVSSGSSDTDLVMRKVAFDTLIKDKPIKELHKGDISKYMNVVPAFNSVTLVTTLIGGKVDILLVESQHDIDVITNAISDMQAMPRYLYTKKSDRIELYQSRLLYHGWVYSDWRKRLRYLPQRLLNLFRS